ncbi:hypothetical protein E5843_04785 [Luteimonas yindakuii]|nr:hypothetical protein E5843_04785 [Luteimonas yindakuii]
MQRPTRWHAVRTTLAVVLAALLAACGGEDAKEHERGTPESASDVAALPAPAPGAGSVTLAPPAPTPAAVPLGDHPVQEAWIHTEGTDGLPPLEDNPEAGLVELVPIVPVDPDTVDAGPLAPSPVPVAADVDTGRATAVVQAYYAAIDARDYRSAYALWSDGGRASGQSPEQFATGFAATRAIEVQVGAPGAADGATGSQYVRVPVSVVATQADGSTRRYAGQYTLRRAASGGGDAWRIASAELREERL